MFVPSFNAGSPARLEAMRPFYRLALPLLFVSGPFFLSAQISLRGQILNLPPGVEIVVEPWYGDRWQPGDVLPLGADGAFSVYVETAPPGQYRLRASDDPGRWVDFIWPAPELGDSILTFHLDYQTMQGGPAPMTDSRENEAYTAVRLGHQKLNAVRAKKPDAPTEATAVAEFNRRCRDVLRRFPGTFTATVVAPLLYEVQPSDFPGDSVAANLGGMAFQRAYALARIPFQSAGILRHNALVQALNRYYVYLERGPEIGRQYVEGIMGRRNGNEEVDGFLFNYLLGRMLDSNNEPGLTYLLEHYPPDCSAESPLPDATKNLVQALQACTPGRIAPDLQLPGPDGQPVALSDVCGQYKLTLMFIWRTNCPVCEAFAPVLADLYRQLHPLGLEVYAVSLDRDAADWKAHLAQHPAPWPQVWVPDDQRQTFSRQFPTPGTPTLISFDSERRVLSRLIARQTLETYLKEALKRR